MTYPFVKGLVLAERLYYDGVAPLMARHFPDQLTNLVCMRDWPGRRAGLVGLYAPEEE